MFISFEGIDGCGKSTQVTLLEAAIRAAGRNVLLVRDPGHTPLSEAIRGLLLDKQQSMMTARTELLLYSAARAQMVETVICPALEARTVVICDRFIDSTIAYQGFGRQLPMADIERCNAVATSGLLPDLTLFLDIPLALSKRRCGDKGADRIELAGDAFFQRVIAGYHHLAFTQPDRVRRLDAERSVAELHEQIWCIVSEHTSFAA